MSNIFVEGFGLYGQGTVSRAHTNNVGDDGIGPVGDIMLQGAYSTIGAIGPGIFIAHCPRITIEEMPQSSVDGALWLRVIPYSGAQKQSTTRIPLKATATVLRASFHLIVVSFQLTGVMAVAQQHANSGGLPICWLSVNPVGGLVLQWGAATGKTAVSAPGVITPGKDSHIETSLDTTAGTFVAYVDGKQALNVSGMVFDNAGPVAAYDFLVGAPDGGDGDTYREFAISDLILRDALGTRNNTFPIGDRRVATLLPNYDDPAHQGWVAQPLRKFGPGILAMTADVNFKNGLYFDKNLPAAYQLAAGSFTIEGWFRFKTLPAGTDAATLFGCWASRQEASNRSWRLVKYGSGASSGNLVFETSTDGVFANVVQKISVPWNVVTGHWHHLAVTRDVDQLRLFIDGVQVGSTVTDADSYFAPAGNRACPSVGVSGPQLQNTSYTYDGFSGWQDEFRLTVGSARYTGLFTPQTAPFPRGVTDPLWASVAALAGWDAGLVDESSQLAVVRTNGNAASILPTDGYTNFDVIDKATPDDNTFLEASLTAATGVLRMTALPTAGETVTVGTKDGVVAAVYTFRSGTVPAAFDVLIGANTNETIQNLVAAINLTSGAGTIYGTGTTTNNDVEALGISDQEMRVTALVPGVVGNAIATTATTVAAAWDSATLTGGKDIPPFSRFGVARLPSNTTIVDSVTLVSRQWTTDTGIGAVKQSFVGPKGAVVDGAASVLGTAPIYVADTFETDPDTGGALTPTTVRLGRVQVDRTT